MDFLDILYERTFTDIAVRWVVLFGSFLLLLYLFRERVSLEGLPGFLMTLFGVIPLNLVLGIIITGLKLPFITDALAAYFGPFADFIALLLFNLVILIVFIKVLGWMNANDDRKMLYFICAFTFISYLLHLVPPIPEIKISISGDSHNLLGTSFLDTMMRWVILVLTFLSLTYVFREKVYLEGTPGFLVMLLVVVPLNVLLGGWVASSTSISAETVAVTSFSLLLGLNLILLFCFNQFIPGLVTSSYMALVLFALIFSVLASIIRLIPDLPPIVPAT